MRLTRVLTVLAVSVTTTAVLAAPAAASDAVPAPYIYPPVFDPLQSIRPLLTSSVDADHLVTIGAVAVDASAITSAIAIDTTRPTIKHTALLDNNSSISSYCTYVRSGVGVATGGVDFTVAAEATAYGRYKGVEIVATGVECKLYKPDMTIGTGAIFAPGSVSVATKQRTSYDARGGHVCVEAWALLRSVPYGESSALKSTGVSCYDV